MHALNVMGLVILALLVHCRMTLSWVSNAYHVLQCTEEHIYPHAYREAPNRQNVYIREE